MQPPLRVLLVEDEADLRRREVEYLRLHGVDVAEAGDLATARAFLKAHRFDIVALDLKLGKDSGMDLLHDIGPRGFPPVVITSVLGESTDRVLGLELGADDYLAKPYSFGELLARLRTVHRRTSEPARRPASRSVRFDRWTLDLSAHTLAADDGARVTVTAGELGVLRVLLDHPGQVVGRQDFLAMTRHDDSEVFERTVDVLVTRLRRKIEREPRRPAVIRTVRGVGYQLTCDVTWSDG
jgi:two-component system OmpR family response regulator